MEIRLLGPVEAGPDGHTAGLGGPRQRAVLAMLALAAPEVVSTDRLVDGIWGESPPAKPLATLQVFIHNLRKALRVVNPDGDLIISRAPGYALADVTTDAQRFVESVERARRLRTDGETQGAAAALRQALSLWRGLALADLREAPFADAESVRLEELRLLAEEDSFDLALQLGQHQVVIADLEERVRSHPTRERFWGQLMMALYRGDRQSDALAAYTRARDQLADELGIDPGEALQQLEVAILRQDPALAAPAVPRLAQIPEQSDGTAPLAPRRGGRIPRPATTTYGREELVAEVLATLARDDVRVVTLTGPGGSGKSRVAALAAAREAAVRPDHVWYLTATEQTDSAKLARDIVRLLTGAEAPAESPFAALEEHLSAMVVLDNLEVLADADTLVSTLIDSAPGVTVLATSRLPLRLRAEHDVAVPPLAVPDEGAGPEQIRACAAVALFADRAATSRPGFSLDAHLEDVAALCRFLDGVPLALELAAARVKLLAPAAILEHLHDGLTLLSSDAADLPERHRTLTATLQWSYERLDAPARLVCDRLALFERDFTIEALEAICGDVPSVLEALTSLLDARLIRSVESRVEMRLVVLGTVRAFARQRLTTQPDVDVLRERLARHLLARLQDWRRDLDGPQGAVVLGRFDDEAPDMAAAHDWTLHHGRTRLAVDLAVALQDFWVASGRLADGLDRLRRTSALPGLDDADRAALSCAAGKLTYLRTDWTAAGDYCATALSLAAEDGPAPDPVVAATARTYQGGAAALTGDPVGGAALAEQALDAATAHDLYPLRAVALSMLAISAAVQGDFAAERSRYEERLAVVRERGDSARIADTLNTLAEIALDEGDAVTARVYGEESTRIAGTVLPLETRDALITLARADCLDSDVSAAAARIEAALELSDRTGQSLAVAQCLRTGGCVAVLLGEPATALRFFAAAQGLSASPSGTDDPVEHDFAAQLAAARAALAPEVAAREWRIGGTLPLASVRSALTELLDRVTTVVG